MRIDPSHNINAAGGIKATGHVRRSGHAHGPAGDGLSVSSMGQDIQKALAALGGLPDIRADRVAALKAQIDAGTYNVSGRTIAETVVAGAADNLL